MIELKNLSKIYIMGQLEVKALHGIESFVINRGEFISIAGPSGSGKSTLLHILGALDLPTEGEYILDGVNIAELDDGELSRIRNEHFGFVFQSYNLFPELSAIENVSIPLMYAGVSMGERREKARSLLKMVGLEHRLNHFPTQLSGGEQQRVAVARALANDPTLLLADEPTGNLSTKHENDIMSLFVELNNNGVTIAIVTHSSTVAGYGKRLVSLTDGKIVSDKLIKRSYRPVEIQNMIEELTVGEGK